MRLRLFSPEHLGCLKRNRCLYKVNGHLILRVLDQIGSVSRAHEFYTRKNVCFMKEKQRRKNKKKVKESKGVMEDREGEGEGEGEEDLS